MMASPPLFLWRRLLFFSAVSEPHDLSDRSRSAESAIGPTVHPDNAPPGTPSAVPTANVEYRNLSGAGAGADHCLANLRAGIQCRLTKVAMGIVLDQTAVVGDDGPQIHTGSAFGTCCIRTLLFKWQPL